VAAVTVKRIWQLIEERERRREATVPGDERG
jgi:hypothetical protein